MLLHGTFFHIIFPVRKLVCETFARFVGRNQTENREMRVIISADRTSDLPDEVQQEYNVPLVP